MLYLECLFSLLVCESLLTVSQFSSDKQKPTLGTMSYINKTFRYSGMDTQEQTKYIYHINHYMHACKCLSSMNKQKMFLLLFCFSVYFSL